MPAILLYLLKVNIALLLFCLGYYAILRQLTFYTLNRVYLLIALLFSSIYPLINFSYVVETHQKLVQPLQVIIIDFNAKAASFAKPAAQTNYSQWLVMIFWAGVILMTIRLLIQFLSLYKLYSRSKPAVLAGRPVRVIREASNPFSFWQSIFINPEKHRQEELQSIIAHEHVHVKQWHTLDILLAELSLVFYWFNPGVWLMKKAISENLEFITDRNILQQGIDAKSYQYSLLYTSLNTSPNAIVNHFNMSTIKKRIMMMNSNRSAFYNLTRYGFIIPAVLVLLLAFSTSKAAFKKSVSVIKHITIETGISPKTYINNCTITVNNSNAKPKLIAIKTDTVKTVKSPANPLIVTLRKTGMMDSALLFLDGKTIRNKELNTLDPANIQNINVVHPSTAKIIFGSTGQKGAVLIFTKQGEDLATTKAIKEKLYRVIGQPSGPAQLRADTQVRVVTSIRSPHKITNDIVSVRTVPLNMSKDTVTYIAGKNNENISVSSRYLDSASQTNEMRSNFGGKPLYIIDGKIAPNAELSALNPNDIYSLSVLKSPAATAIYGDKGKHGAIIVTTKKPKKN